MAIDLERRQPNAISSARWLTISNVGRIACQFVGVYALSRLLTPADFGSMALVVVVTNFAGLLRDMGTGATIVQRETLSEEVLNSVFLFNMVTGLTLCMALAALSGVFARAFDAPQIASLITLSSIVFPIVASAGVHQALLERNSRFLEIAIIETTSYIVGLVIAVLLARRGYGAVSLVVQAIVSACINTASIWARSPWRPRTRTSWTALASVLTQSGTITLYNFVNFISKNVDQVVAASHLGLVPVGFYAQAQKLTGYPQQLTALTARRALAPKFASLQNNMASLRDITARTLAFMLSVSGIIVCIILGNSRNFVTITLGGQWGAVSDLLYFLLPTAVFNALTATVSSYLIAISANRRLLVSGIVSAALLVMCAFAGVQGGIAGLCAAMLIHSIISFVMCMMMIQSWRFAKLAMDYSARPLLIILFCGLIAHLIQIASTFQGPPFSAPLASTGLSSLGAGCAFIALTFFFDRTNFHWIAKLVGLRLAPRITRIIA